MSSGPGPDRPLARADWRQMLVIGVIAAALGIAAGLLIDWFPVSASKEAKPIDTLWDVLIICSVPVFVLVVTVVLFSVWKFRMRPGEELMDGPPIHGNTRLEIVWTAIPAILLVALCTYAFLVLRDVEAKAANAVQVRVVGQQFAWTFYYRVGGKEVASPQLYVPLDRQVEFTLQSKDVLHDFWVPAFRIKKDAVPGLNVKYVVTASKLGDYAIVCAELCGLGHSTMRGTAHVLEEKAYDAQLQKLAGAPAAAKTPAAQGAPDGKALFTSSGCNGCHTLADAGATGTVGPNLGEVLKGKDPAFIKTSIVDPNAEIAPGFQPGIMPGNFGQSLSGAEIDALVKYLSDVTKGG